MLILINVLEILLLLYLGGSALYTFAFAVFAFLPDRYQPLGDGQIRKFLVLIPGYKEDAVIVSTAKAALEQDYPQEHYDVRILADSFQESTLAALRDLPIDVQEVRFETSTKSKAIHEALKLLPEGYDSIAILDADNVMDKQFLSYMNAYLEEGHLAIQGRRVAKNSETPMAVLDAISEEVNNRIYCKGPTAVGLSSKLSGSGMAFDYQTFRRVMLQVFAIGGFDKELELRFTREKIHVAYHHQAKVYDEKVRNPEVYSKQRRRWLSAQYAYLNRFFGESIRKLLTEGNSDFFHKVMQLALPPRLILPVALFLGAVVSWLLDGQYIWWCVATGLSVSSFLLAIPRYLYNRNFVRSMLHLPKVLLYTVLALKGLRKANKKFIHTPHGNY
ncbi:MAG: glycosyltransferase family 2 protein [Bacteroidota bacterium]